MTKLYRLEKYDESSYHVYANEYGLVGHIELYGPGDWLARAAEARSIPRHFAYRKEAIEWLLLGHRAKRQMAEAIG